MSKKYTHLSLVQRYQIEVLQHEGCPQNKIAAHLGVNPSTISRELKRNVGSRGKHACEYKAYNAQRLTDLRHNQKPKRRILDQPMKERIVFLLRKEKWSPELISQLSRRKGELMVSAERIYQWIWDCKHSHKGKNRSFKNLYKLLKHGRRRAKRGNRRNNRGIIHGRIGIEKRPSIVKKRKRPGDLEIDLMMGKNHDGAILVITDRATLHTQLKKLSSKDSKAIVKAITGRLRNSKYKIHTLTFDNDQAFSGHATVGRALGIKTYFTRPYTSQDKGTVENRIGVLRRFLPKKTDLNFVTHQQIKKIQAHLNNRPVRKFNYLTPNQVLQQKIALAG